MLDASAWKKQAYPVLTSSDVPGEYGPGHNSFTVDEEGNPVFVYHARGEACYKDECNWANQDPLYDPCRDARLKRVHWSVDGAPILKMSYAEELAEENQTVTATVKVTKNAQQTAAETVKRDFEKISLEKINDLTVDDTAAIKLVYPDGFKAALTTAGLEITTECSSKDAAVTVTKDGKITAAAAGKATITVIIALNDAAKTSRTLTAVVNVKAKTTDTGDDNNTNKDPEKSDADPAKIGLNVAKNISMGIGEKITAQATVTNKAGEILKNQKLTWSVDKKGKNAITLKNGKITAKKAGTAKITVKTSNGKKAMIKVTVKKKVTKIKLTAKNLKKGKVTLKKGQKLKLGVKFTPSKAATYKMTYKSNKKKVASVSDKGVVKALKKGTATITVKTYNGKSAKVKVTVK